LGEVEDIANAALFLGSGAAAYMTGSEINIDGGAYLTHPNLMFAVPEFKEMYVKAKL
jgi:enoyl-[acyl-carrier-protein] reductase (NADH)